MTLEAQARNVKARERNEAGWRAAGQEIAPLLRRHTAAVVTGSDVTAVAFASLGIAEAEAPYRSVVIASLWDSTELDSLIGAAPDAPGVSDCFNFGISLATAERTSLKNERLAVIGMGTEEFDQLQVFRSRRWKAYAERLLDAGSLLLLLAPSEAEGIHELIAQVDGIVLAGAGQVGSAPHARVIARIPHPIITPTKDEKEEEGVSWKRVLTVFATLLFIALAVAAGLYYFWLRQSKLAEDQAAGASAIAALSSTVEASSSTPALSGIPVILNAGDSAKSARFSVEILAANTQSGAIFTLRKYRSSIPAGTVSAIPVGPDQALWYKVIGGAFAKREDADSLLVSLRRKKIIPQESGTVVETPLAFLVDSVSADSGMVTRLKVRVDSLLKGEFSVYALKQDDGSARIYAGAFSSATETKQFADQLKVAGITPVLAYRTGRNP